MTAPIDEWLGRNSPGSAAHLHAVGAFAIFYNDLELALYGLFRRYLPGANRPRNVLFEALHNRERVDLLRAYVDLEHDADFQEGARRALACFDICAENRNLILHAMSDLDKETEFLRLVKIGGPSRKKGGSPVAKYRFAVEDLRQAALDTYNCETYIAQLLKRDEEPSARAWPAIPPLPRKLSLCRHVEAPEDEQPPPRS